MKKNQFIRAALLLLFPLLGAARAGDADGRLTLAVPAEEVEVFERVEIAIDGVPAADNPFDPEAIALDLEVTAPSGQRLRVPGYFQQDYNRRLDGNREVLTPQGEGTWRVRWLPMEPGRHTLVATVTRAGKPAARGEAAVEVAPGKHHGLVRVEPEGKRYFRLDDGTPLFLNGLCACWHGRRGTYDYDDWLAAYEKAGINYIRIWMWHQAFGIEWDKGDKLHYRLDNAWRLDRVLAEAERRGVFVMLCLDYHGIFEVKPDYWGGNNFWPRHPYNAVNGGPCQTQNDFFTNEEAKRLYAKRLRYIVARWSAFPNILAWEFFNEIDNEYAYVKHEDVVAWHGAMGRHLRSIDPFRHLISSSFTGGSERPDLFALPEMDFAQYHSYNEKHPARMTAEKTARFFEKYHKPFFVSEYGTDWRGWKPDTDPHFRALHQAIWSGAFTGAAGTDMTWWWESIHTGNLYHHWSALSRFLEGTAMGRADLQPARFGKVEGSVTPFGVAASDEALVWLLDRAYDWPDGAMEASPSPANGVKVSLTGVRDGAWSVEWWDTLAGQRVATTEAKASGGVLPLAAPTFHVDIAARLTLSHPPSAAASAPIPPDSANRDLYGGWKGLRFEPTGFFAVRQHDGCWWLVTPEGYAFLSKGVNHVSFRADDAPLLGYSPYQRAVEAQYGSQEAWAKAVVDRLRGWGFNTLGSWSSPSTFDHNMPYTVNLDLATRAGADWLKGAVGDFFSRDFEEKMEAACRQLCGPRAQDPWLLGYFTDNELRWGADWRGKESLLEEYLRLPPDAPGRQAALEFLRQRHGDVASLNQAWGTGITRWEELTGREQVSAEAARRDQAAWQEIVARRYFATCKSAIRKADSSHLILGCRFAGQAPDPVLRGLSDSVDVVSFNNYGQTAPVETLQNIHRLTARPMMLTEFSFKATDSGLPNTRGAGRAVPTQSDRTEGFTRYVHGLIDLPFMVGFHWFEHADQPKEGRFDGENSNYGLVTIEDRPWDILVRKMTEVNAGLEARHLRAAQAKGEANGKEASIRRLIQAVDRTHISKHVFYLAQDPLPYRKLNLTLPGHEKNTLYEADDYLAGNLEAYGYRVEREPVQVQAFRRDTSKPKHAQYSPPKPEDPWYTAFNLYAEKKGRSHPEKIILVLAHKDSQSWIDSPGANDNAVGTAGVLEMARVLAQYPSEGTIRFLWCNEEHTPWTSKTAAQNAKARGDDIVAVFNLDGIGAKPPEQTAAGRKTNVTAYTRPEGKPLADLMSEVNAKYSIGLEQRAVQRERPGDDDGSFVLAGYPAAVINIGSWPYGDPNYHAEEDTPDGCDFENAAMTVRATLAAVVTLDQRL